MTTSDIAIPVKSLRAQLDVLEARIRSAPASSADAHTLADLHGMLAAEAQTSAEEIDQALYRVPGPGS